MDFLALVNRAQQECRVSGAAAADVTGQNAEITRLISWTNSAWMDIQRANAFWDFMRASCTCPTVQGRGTYSATDFGLTDFGTWAIDYSNGDTFRNYSNPVVSFTIATSLVLLAGHGLSNGDPARFFTTGALPGGLASGTTYYVVSATADTFQVSATSGGAAITFSGTQSGTQTMTSGNTTSFAGMLSETPMWPMDYDSWRDTYQFGATRQTYSRPVAVATAPNESLAVGPIAASGYTLIGDYYRKATEMALATDVPTMPDQFHMLIVWGAAKYFAASEAAPEVWDAAVMNYERIFRQLTAHQAPRMRLAGALC